MVKSETGLELYGIAIPDRNESVAAFVSRTVGHLLKMGGAIQDFIQEIRRQRLSQGNTARTYLRTNRW